MRFQRIAVVASLLCLGRGSDAEVGIASWYGYPYHGRVAADGNTYDMERNTAAHRTLPLGAWVRVTNLDNSRFVDVRITDRGPFIDGRIIDLSRAAAQAIDVVGRGVAPVRVDVLDSPGAMLAVAPATGPAAYAVQVGAFQDRSRAEQLRTLMEKHYESTSVVQRPGTPIFWRVLVGRKQSAADAHDLADRLQAETGSAFVVRLSAQTAVAVAEAP